jgi:hypothetical protein
MENEALVKVREFLAREDLVGTDAKLKESAIKLDQELSAARVELEQLTKSTNEKQIQVVYLTQRLEALCQLVLQVAGATEVAQDTVATEPAAQE